MNICSYCYYITTLAIQKEESASHPLPATQPACYKFGAKHSPLRFGVSKSWGRGQIWKVMRRTLLCDLVFQKVGVGVKYGKSRVSHKWCEALSFAILAFQKLG